MQDESVLKNTGTAPNLHLADDLIIYRKMVGAAQVIGSNICEQKKKNIGIKHSSIINKDLSIPYFVSLLFHRANSLRWFASLH